MRLSLGLARLGENQSIPMGRFFDEKFHKRETKNLLQKRRIFAKIQQ
jgi:hypothetical protein